MKVVVIGVGYVGLVSGVCFAELGAQVVGLDNDSQKITQLKQGKVTIYEDGLEPMFQANCKRDRLSFTTSYKDHIGDADIIFIAVSTPEKDGHADLSYFTAALKEMSQYLSAYTLVISKSTVPVGVTRSMLPMIKAQNPIADVEVAANPEFLSEGYAVHNFMNPDRIVLGIESKRAEDYLQRLYQPLIDKKTAIIKTTYEGAELIKYASNVLLATKVSFINEIAHLCEQVGADIQEVADGMGLDSRIGKHFLQTGPGFGGSCLPKDTLELIQIAKKYHASSHIAQSVVAVNNAHKARMVEKIRMAIGGNEHNKKITILGLAFKANTDDMREAPALFILPPLIDQGAIITAHDPQAITQAKPLLPDDIRYCDDLNEAITGADAVVILTEWQAYKTLSPKTIKTLMQGNTIIDLRNIYHPDEMMSLGFNYHSVGRPSA